MLASADLNIDQKPSETLSNIKLLPKQTMTAKRAHDEQIKSERVNMNKNSLQFFFNFSSVFLQFLLCLYEYMYRSTCIAPRVPLHV